MLKRHKALYKGEVECSYLEEALACPCNLMVDTFEPLLLLRCSAHTARQDTKGPLLL